MYYNFLIVQEFIKLNVNTDIKTGKLAELKNTNIATVFLNTQTLKMI